MRFVVFKSEGERLTNILCFVCILKQDLAFIGETFNCQTCFLANESRFLCSRCICLFSDGFFRFIRRILLLVEIIIKLKNRNFSRFDRGWSIHLIFGYKSVVIIVGLLFENVNFNLLKFKDLFIPNFCLKIFLRQSHSDKLIIYFVGTVMSYHKEVIGTVVLSSAYRALLKSFISISFAKTEVFGEI